MTRILINAIVTTIVAVSGAAHATPFENGSFESQNLNQSWVGYLYGDAAFNQSAGYGPVAVDASGWLFSSGSGLSYTNTWGPQRWDGVATDGDVFGFLRNSGAEISQTFQAGAGSYTFSYDFVQRTNWRVGGPQTVSVLFDGNTVWSGTPGDSWSTFSFSAMDIAAGNHTLSFHGTNLTGASDTSVFVDNVRLSFSPVSAIPEPESYALMLAGLSLLVVIARRRSACR